MFQVLDFVLLTVLASYTVCELFLEASDLLNDLLLLNMIDHQELLCA
jgi:hypothetical protein